MSDADDTCATIMICLFNGKEKRKAKNKSDGLDEGVAEEEGLT